MREENEKNRESQLKIYQMECNHFLQAMQMMIPQQNYGNIQFQNAVSTPSSLGITKLDAIINKVFNQSLKQVFYIFTNNCCQSI